jgi:hypothetical protein
MRFAPDVNFKAADEWLPALLLNFLAQSLPLVLNLNGAGFTSPAKAWRVDNELQGFQG